MISTTADLRLGIGAIRGLRQAIEARGEDAVAYLQGQLSQDVVAMAPGDSRWSLLLHPQGKIAAWLRVTRTGDDSFVLDVDAGWADEVIARLERFKLRTRCELTVLAVTSLTLVGPGTAEADVEGVELDIGDRFGDVEARVVFGPDPSTDVDVLPADVATSLRVEAGRPAMGAELDDTTIPATAGDIVDKSVSFTKGCYTGQELVARIDSRGNKVPKRLVGLVFSSGEPSADAVVTVDGTEVGLVTSVGESGVLAAPVALAYVARSVDAGARVSVGAAVAQLRELPLVSG